MREYDLIADWYWRERDLQTGVPEASAFAASLPRGARVLDLGCGTGIPITQTVLTAGCRVFGIDSSERMLARFRANFPETPVVQGLLQSPSVAARAFDAAVAWGVMFHLKHDEQVMAMANLARMLRAGAPFLFTAGDKYGSIDGVMNEVSFHYFSFDADDYGALLRENGFTLLETHVDEGGNMCYLARRSD